MPIPKLIHQIWIGPHPLPEREVKFCERLKAMHPEYMYYLYRDADVPLLNLSPAVQEQYDAHCADGKWAFASDILRLWIVFQFGGWYLDVDFECVTPLDGLSETKGVLCYHPTANPPDYTIVNGAFASEAKSPWLATVVDRIKSPGWWYGPQWMGQVVKEHLRLPYETDHATVKQVLHSQEVSYMDWQHFISQYARHHALYSWRNQ